MQKFPGQGQNDTPVTDARGVITIINSLGGSRAAKFRQKFADTLVRYLGGDENLIGEIRSIREAQRQLLNSHPLRVFGQTVEAERKAEDDVADGVQRAIKRQRLQNELDQEIAQARRAIKLQDCRQTAEAKCQILEILSGGAEAGTPAVTGMISAARHNFASQSLAQLTVPTGDLASGPQAAAQALQEGPRPRRLRHGG